MATTAQPQSKCSKCGKIFDSPGGQIQHEKTCSGKDRVAGTPTTETTDQIKKDMQIEDRFDATDN